MRLFLNVLILLLLLNVFVGGNKGKVQCPKGCALWEHDFLKPPTSKIIRRDCRGPGGHPICCEAVSEQETYRGIGLDIEDDENDDEDIFEDKDKDDDGSCTVDVVYVSSPQEEREINAARMIDVFGSDILAARVKIATETNNATLLKALEPDYVSYGTDLPRDLFELRKLELLTYLTNDEYKRNATTWLDRVAQHMRSEKVPEESSVDREYLSRFEYTKSCQRRVVDRWTEWIEPLTTTARHPMGLSTCRPARKIYADRNVPSAGRTNTDYVLLKSGKQLHRHENIIQKNADKKAEKDKASQPDSKNKSKNKGRRDLPPQHFFLDAGSSTFDSSVNLFACAYSQRRVAFDQVFAWELSLLEPVKYWSHVPGKWVPYMHFYNTPVGGDSTHAHSPDRIIRSIARPKDFVSFKLDIDYPSIEMKLAMELLGGDSNDNNSGSGSGSGSDLASLVDEFFFELHFRCEVMTNCGWGKSTPPEMEGLQMVRGEVLEFFRKIRRKGVRAHVWP